MDGPGAARLCRPEAARAAGAAFSFFPKRSLGSHDPWSYGRAEPKTCSFANSLQDWRPPAVRRVSGSKAATASRSTRSPGPSAEERIEKSTTARLRGAASCAFLDGEPRQVATFARFPDITPPRATTGAALARRQAHWHPLPPPAATEASAA
jgi:hypothetical protein